MSALAEALVAAQRRAMQAVEKAYVAGALEREEASHELRAVGATDAVDRDALLDALDTLRRYGAPLPAEPRPNGDAEPAKATPAQVTYAQSLSSARTSCRSRSPTFATCRASVCRR